MTPRQQKTAEIGVAYFRLLNPDLRGIEWVEVVGLKTLSELELAIHLWSDSEAVIFRCRIISGAHIWAEVKAVDPDRMDIERAFCKVAEKVAARPRNKTSP